ncbi:hypothetical protein GDO81_014194 [Engystomops pustulosus]|uniref:cyclin-dependent kinase n=1 Tax=Engystomops pustulosus TaxID=76066 RepID=A0AAV7B8M9_ENGPU|nr:hypothetical protein GDO81_014194 [Engystomops pustulosus]
MGDEKDNWKVKTLDEILQEKKRRKEQEEKSDSKHPKNADDRDSKRDSLEEGELRDHRMEITIRNSPYRREDSMEDRGEEDDSLAIKPPQQVSRKEKSHHRKDEKRKEKRRHRSHSAEGAGGKYVRVKEKDREHERRKRHREEQDKVRRERERQKRRELAREHSRRERDRLEQLERNRERERKMREQQKEQRELKERQRRAEERRKGRESRREVAAHHRTAREEHSDKSKAAYRSRSPIRQQRERLEPGDMRKQAKEERPDVRDLLSDLQDISDSERKTSSAASSTGSVSGTEEEEETSSEESEEVGEEDEEEDDEEEEEEEETGSNSEAASEQTAEEVSDEEMSEEDDRENGNHIPVVTESRFDHDSPESEEEEEEEEEEEIRNASPHSNAQTDGEYVPDSPVMSPVELKQELPKYLPALQGCRSVEEFQCLNRIEEGTYGVVYRAKDKKTDEIVALKRLKMEKEKEGFPITSLREINTILKAQHDNIVRVREIVVGSNMDKIYIVMNYVEHDLKSLMETMKQPFLPGEVKTLMIQLLRGVRHLHDNWILHRDLKTSNLLLSHAGILKVGDFGLAREYGSPLKPYTPIVVTLWYRAPELLLGAKVRRS